MEEMTDFVYAKRKEKLKNIIRDKVFISASEEKSFDGLGRSTAWAMDFRNILLNGEYLSDITELLLFLLEKEKVSKVQFGGLESAAIPLVTSFVTTWYSLRGESSGFFIRKSRKKTGLLKLVEGDIGDASIVLLDDLLNTGNSILKQINILESMGKTVSYVCVIVRFRKDEEYHEILSRGIKIVSIFSLEELDFVKGHGLPSLLTETPQALQYSWMFSSPSPAYQHVLPKSKPLLIKNNLYFGSDNGTFWCVNTEDGSVKWQRKVLYGAQSKKIFSSPCFWKDIVFFGGYDGNFYALDSKTGKPKWVAFDADWIGSSPCVADDLGLVFVGMEYGFWKKKGGVAAYRADTGTLAWLTESKEYVHGSPVYSKKNHIVICGSNDGCIYGISARKGNIIWKHDTQGEVKAGCALSPNETYVAVGSFNNHFVILKTKTGEVVATIPTLEANYSTPAWVDDSRVVCASLDKHVYLYSLLKKEILWKYLAGARIFASPVVYKGVIYCGTNEGVVMTLSVEYGKCVSKKYVIERVTNAVVIDDTEHVVYIPTQANQIIKTSLENL